MASPWALERFGGLTGSLTRRVPQAVGTALEKAFARRHAAGPKSDDTAGDRHRALRHAVIMSGSSNQALLDVRWGEAAIADDRAATPRSRI